MPYHLRGLGDPTPLVSSIASAIAQMEGYNTPGTIAAKNNNPGNVRSGAGQIGTSGGFAVFPDAATGWAALDYETQRRIAAGENLQQFFGGGTIPGYAPAADSNNPTGYAAFVAQQIGVDPTVSLSSVSSPPLAPMGPPLLPDDGSTVLNDGSVSSDSSTGFDLSSVFTDQSSGGISSLGWLGIAAGAVGLVVLTT